MFEQILKAIEAHDTVILHRHKNPDGDALGSQIGLKHLLRENFPEKTVLCVGDEARNYSFMEDSVMDQVADEAYADALAIVLDSGAAALVSDERYKTAHATARIDHHMFQEQFTDTEVIDSTFESCCGMITEMAREATLRFTGLAAQSLYTGMLTDSGRFRYDSTSPRTMRLAALLLEQDFDPADIYRYLYADDLKNKQLRAKFLLKARLTPHGVGYTYTDLQEFAALDADTFTVSRGMANVLSDTKGVEIWANFTETEQGVLCELRSSLHNIQHIAVKYGGGGHAKACGATVPDRAAVEAMLCDLDKILEG